MQSQCREVSIFNSVEILKEAFRKRVEKNSSYSMRAFARDLDVSPSLLTRIFNGERTITVKLALQFSLLLDFNDETSNQLLSSAFRSSSEKIKTSHKFDRKVRKNPKPEYQELEIEHFRAMAKWYHLAILNLTEIEDFKYDCEWIASVLDIGLVDCQTAIARLIELKLLMNEDGKLVRSSKSFYCRTEHSDLAVKKFHCDMMTKAKDQLEFNSDVDFKRRLINGITFSCTKDQVQLIKERINRFEDEILEITNKTKNSELYQMNFQFFPLMKN